MRNEINERKEGLILFIVVTLFILCLYFVLLNSINLNSLKTMVNKMPKRIKTQIENAPKVGAIAPFFNLNTIDNKSYTSVQLFKKPTVLLVASDSCPYCSIHLQDFLIAVKEYSKGQQYNFAIIIKRYKDDLNFFNELSASIKDKQISIPVLISNEEFIKNYKLRLFPTFIFVTEKGYVGSIPRFTHEFPRIFEEHKNKLFKQSLPST